MIKILSRPVLTRISAGLFVLLLVFVAFDQLLKDRMFPKRWTEVEDGLVYRSGQIHSDLIESTLLTNSIDKVIDLQYWEEKPELIAEKAAIDRLGIMSERYPLNGDGRGDVASYVSAMLSIHKSRGVGERVLVHCAAGSQRTGGVLAAYRTLVIGITAEQAVDEMVQHDWNPKKDQVLLDFLNDNIRYLAQQMVLAGVINQVPAELPVFLNPLGA